MLRFCDSSLYIFVIVIRGFVIKNAIQSIKMYVLLMKINSVLKLDLSLKSLNVNLAPQNNLVERTNRNQNIDIGILVDCTKQQCFV